MKNCHQQRQQLLQQKKELENQNEEANEIKKQELEQELKWKAQIEELTRSISQKQEARAAQQQKYITDKQKIEQEEKKCIEKQHKLVEQIEQYQEKQKLKEAEEQKKQLIKKALQKSDFQHRFALVIGNQKYPKAPLKNPINDAKDIANVLILLGFQVELLYNARCRDMKDAVRKFAAKATGLGENSIAFIFYAGILF